MASGEELLPPTITRRVIAQFAAQPDRAPASPSSLEVLTDREREILTQVAAGLSNDEIAAALVISPGTVRTHLNHVMTKLGRPLSDPGGYLGRVGALVEGPAFWPGLTGAENLRALDDRRSDGPGRNASWDRLGRSLRGTPDTRVALPQHRGGADQWPGHYGPD